MTLLHSGRCVAARVLVGAAAALCLTSAAFAQVSHDVVRIGVLTDLNGDCLRSRAGLGGCGAHGGRRFRQHGTRQADRDHDADHQNKADIGAQIAQQWFDIDGVDMVVRRAQFVSRPRGAGLASRGVAFSIASAGGTADLTGKSCSPTGIHWTWDTYAAAVSTARAIVGEGGETWFFLTADYAFGHAMERDASRVVKASGGKVARFGVDIRLNTSDFSSFLLQAQARPAPIVRARQWRQRHQQLAQAGARIRTVRRRSEIRGAGNFITDVQASVRQRRKASC